MEIPGPPVWGTMAVGPDGEVYVAGSGGEDSGGSLEAEFSGDDEAIADLLAMLLARGVRVLSFTETTSDLEEVFLRLTKGEVA